MPHMVKKILIVVLFIAPGVYAQDDYAWWNAKHNWDGHSPWTQYLTLSPSFMGPNALPVPEVTTGEIDSVAELEIAGDYYFSKGDKTKDFFLRGILPLYSDRVSVSVEVVPYEWFKTDTITRDVRAARGRTGKGGSGGDIYFMTSFTILKNRPSLPGLALRAGLRMASGTNLGDARFTDGPGYFFDLSGGKNIDFTNSILRLYGMAGFYAYQTFDVEHLQNDCIMYGVGADLYWKKFKLSQSLGGYSGYLDLQDQPLVYRFSFRMENGLLDYEAGYLWGIRDYDFQRIRISVIAGF
jgi:hypothetical protein